MLYDKCLEMSYKNSLTSDQNIVPSCAIVPNIDRQSYLNHRLTPMGVRSKPMLEPFEFGASVVHAYSHGSRCCPRISPSLPIIGT